MDNNELTARFTENKRKKAMCDHAARYADADRSDPFAFNRAMSHMQSNVGIEFHRVIKNHELVDAILLRNQFCYGAEKKEDGTIHNIRRP